MDKDSQQVWWQPAIKIFVQISGLLVGPIVIALLLGRYLDEKFDKEPWFFLGLTTIAFIISITSLIKIGRNYIEKIEREQKNKETNKHESSTINNSHR